MHSIFLYTQQGSFNTFCVCMCNTVGKGLKKVLQQNYAIQQIKDKLSKQQFERRKQTNLYQSIRRVSKAERMSARGRISKDKVAPSRKTVSPPVSKRTRLCGKRRRMASAASAASEVAKAASRSFAAGAATKECDQDSVSGKTVSPPVSKRTRLCGKRRRMASAASAASEVAKAASRSFAAGAATEECDQDSVSALMSSSPALTPSASTKTVRQTSLAGISNYEIQETRGRGNYGVVYKSRRRVDNKIVAIKKTTIDGDGEGIPGTTLREVSLLKDLQHNNIVS